MQSYSKYLLLIVLVVSVFFLVGSSPFTSDIPNIIMVDIPGGTFEMGCSPEDDACNSDELPRHTVTISPFKMSAYEITQAQWVGVMGSNPSHFWACPDCPVENMYWEDLQNFITKLNQMTGMQYRLPTEAEWEYAARAGTTTRYYCGNNESCLGNIAWYDHVGESTHPVGQKPPNAWGLYDMSGNVWERCQDWYDPNYYSQSPSSNPQGPNSGVLNHVRRGGSWVSRASLCRSSQRAVSGNPQHGYDLGFRLCLPYSTSTTSIISTTSTIPLITTTTTIGNGCPPASPIDCGNGWCCSLDYPICGYGEDEGSCFSDGATTTTTIDNGCPPASPIDCGNGWCCSLDYPICGYGEDEGSCFSNGACLLEELYGVYSGKIELLRYFRDNVLSQTPLGKEIIRLYYQWSSVIVKEIEKNEEFKEEVKEMIDGVLMLITEEAE